MDALELERRLLKVYPQAEQFLATLKKHNSLGEVKITKKPHRRLRDQRSKESPFWILVQEEPHAFRAISFGLNPEYPSLTFARERGEYGRCVTYREEFVKEYLQKNPQILSTFYEENFFI